MSRFRFRGRRRRAHASRQAVPLRNLVPNMVTSLAACAGITSISLSSDGRFSEALVALLVACVCDGMDGRIARLLKASSKLGAELDSLADFVNFGVAPAMFMYFWLTGKTFGAETAAITHPAMVRAVLGCALFYAMCNCFRLARFNTMLEQDPVPYWKNFFTGVPAPGGCWMVLTPYLLIEKAPFLHLQDVPGAAEVIRSPVFGMVMLLFVGALMASRLPTISLKAVHVSKRARLPVMAFAMLLIACLFWDLWLTLGILGALYLLTVPLTGLVFLKVRAKYMRGLTSAVEKV
ncbi:MAG: CDP-alcohol phosphatidyltransferase family protein [Kiritimatiellia bacterium]